MAGASQERIQKLFYSQTANRKRNGDVFGILEISVVFSLFRNAIRSPSAKGFWNDVVPSGYYDVKSQQVCASGGCVHGFVGDQLRRFHPVNVGDGEDGRIGDASRPQET